MLATLLGLLWLTNFTTKKPEKERLCDNRIGLQWGGKCPPCHNVSNICIIATPYCSAGNFISLAGYIPRPGRGAQGKAGVKFLLRRKSKGVGTFLPGSVSSLL